jgi:hypothetical protein
VDDNILSPTTLPQQLFFHAASCSDALCTAKKIYVFPEMKLRSLVPNFYSYSHDQSPYFAAAK